MLVRLPVLFAAALLRTTAACSNSDLGCLTCCVGSCSAAQQTACTNAGCQVKQQSFWGVTTTTCYSASAAAGIDQANAAVQAFATCHGITSETACASQSGCGWLGVVCTTSDAATAANTAFTQGSANLQALGNSIANAAKSLTSDATAMANKVQGLTSKDVEALVEGVRGEMANGVKVTIDAAQQMMDKVKGSGAWGAVSTWTADKLEQAGDLMEGLSASDLRSVAKTEFMAAADTFGAVSNWAKDQAASLATKFKETMPDLAAATSAELQKIKGFVNGFDASDLRKITKNAFAGATAAFKEGLDKVDAFASDQAAEIGQKVKELAADLGGVAALTGQKIQEWGSLVGTLDANDLKTLADDAVRNLSDKATKVMGGAKTAAAFSAEQIRKMTQAARDAINGVDLQAVADAAAQAGEQAADKVKALLNCDDAAGSSNPCPGAVADITVLHDKAAETAAEIKAKIESALAAAGQTAGTTVSIVQADFAASAPTARRRRRRRSQRDRRLSGTSSGTGDSQSVVRITSSTNTAATAAGTTAAAATGGSSTVVSVTATDTVPTATAGGSTAAPAPPALAMALTAAAVVIARAM